MSTLLEVPLRHDQDRALTTVRRSGRFSRKIRCEWPRAGSWISFDSMYEYNYWLYIRHLIANNVGGVVEIVRNTTKLAFPEPVEYEANGRTYTLSAYRPDFLILKLDGGTEWVEIKGWQNGKHQATRAALARFFPYLNVALVTRETMLEIQRDLGAEIDGWVKFA